MYLTKHHGLGNDFLVALEELNPGLVPGAGASGADGRWADLARALCDRRSGLGADGLIFGLRPSPRDRTDGVDVDMVLFNSDGSTAELSGNGLRCLAQAVLRHRGMAAGSVVASTAAGLRPMTVSSIRPSLNGSENESLLATLATVDHDGGVPRSVLVEVDMGSASPGPTVAEESLPAPDDADQTPRHMTVALGNPHIVFLMDDISHVDLASWGPRVESVFPDGINVHAIAVTSDTSLDLRVWERGAGITQACGSGACAAAVVAHRWGLVADAVDVSMPGGKARIAIGETISLEGPAEFVAEVHPW